jgi:hypothetical protein
MDIVAALPWPVGLVLGIVAFLGIRYGRRLSVVCPLSSNDREDAKSTRVGTAARAACCLNWLRLLFSNFPKCRGTVDTAAEK